MAAAPAAPARRLGEGSLYEKLLAKEIREDRSRLLQALRFIVSRGFFADEGGKGGEPGVDATT